jgi:hypothetical protein
MKIEYCEPTQLIEKRKEYEKGANTPTLIDIHKCFCGLGRIEHCRVPGFDDDYFVIKCLICGSKYSFIDTIGYDWEVHLK